LRWLARRPAPGEPSFAERRDARSRWLGSPRRWARRSYTSGAAIDTAAQISISARLAWLSRRLTRPKIISEKRGAARPSAIRPGSVPAIPRRTPTCASWSGGIADQRDVGEHHHRQRPALAGEQRHRRDRQDGRDLRGLADGREWQDRQGGDQAQKADDEVDVGVGGGRVGRGRLIRYFQDRNGPHTKIVSSSIQPSRQM
jgi:hypothetical protein